MFMPFNGCDNCSGSSVCSDCMSKVNNYLLDCMKNNVNLVQDSPVFLRDFRKL